MLNNRFYRTPLHRSLLALPLLLLLSALRPAQAAPPEEGMWLPMMIERNYEHMRELGFRLSPEDIYSLNNSSLKDAVVSFGGFCTGEIISDQGLILTNHHCGYGSIQALSTVEDNILEEGFWAQTLAEERPAEDLHVAFLVRVEDVTRQVLEAVEQAREAKGEGFSETDRQQVVDSVSKAIEQENSEEDKYDTRVADFYFGAEFYLFVYQEYHDIRLVGTPPESIGKYGGDTDNWMWPRHTGDFSMFRVYTAPDGSASQYSEENVPLKPKHHFPVSLKGVKSGDFTMIMGYPGRTQRYETSHGIRIIYEIDNPSRVRLREERLAIMDKYMEESKEAYIKYASKYSRVSNYWKYSLGQNKGLNRLNTIEKKQQMEADFLDWVNADPKRREEYGMVLDNLAEAYEDYRKVRKSIFYLNEAALAPEINRLALRFFRLRAALQQASLRGREAKTEEGKMAKKMGQKQLEQQLPEIRTYALEDFYPEYITPLDQEVYAAMMRAMYQDLPQDQLPAELLEAADDCNREWDEFAQDVFDDTYFATQERFLEFLELADKPRKMLKKLEKDPVYQMTSALVLNYYTVLAPVAENFRTQAEHNYRKLVKGLKAWKPDKIFYPDANFTMRLTYGTVADYDPMDAVHYDDMTYLVGVMEKEDPRNDEFIVHPKLKDLYKRRDFGPYAAENGQMPVCFINTTDITGGNSGSPVLNGEGHIVGLAFDGNWEAMTGDIVFDKELKRTINVDIRYVLFIVDKFGNCGRLIDEMELVRN